MIDPKMLIDPTQAGMPAPVWFVQFFKALGFTLHAVPMNLWYAGLLIACVLHLRGSEQGRRFAGRLLQQMPVIVAVGINFGIVPLLFIQLAYYKVFYPATILMACFWLAIIVLLIPAYYGVYAYAWGLHDGAKDVAGWRRAAGWCAALFFVCIGFTFANGLSLMEHVPRWPELWNAHSTAGAATGTALNVGDPTLWPRWFLMFGLALGTTAVWVLVDAVFLTRGTTDEAYQRWAWGFARKLYTFGMLWAAAAGSWYVFHAWPANLRDTMFQWPMIVLTVATAVAPGLALAADDDRRPVFGKAGDRGGNRLLSIRRAGRQRRQPADRSEHQPEAVRRRFRPADRRPMGSAGDVPDRLRDRPVRRRLDDRADRQVQAEIAGSQRLPECVWVYGRSPGAVGSR